MTNTKTDTTRRAFGLVSHRDMTEKLAREISRAATASSREDLADHLTNGAWTAWHVHEWIWAGIKQEPCTKVALANAANKGDRKFTQDDFLEFVLSEDQCPQLAFCQTVTAVSKHTKADSEADAQHSIQLSRPPVYQPSGPPLDWLPVHSDGSEQVGAYKIVNDCDLDDKERENAVDWLAGILRYWRQLIADYDL